MADELARLANAVLVPGFVGLAPPDWVLRRAGDGLAGVVLFARNVVDDAQVRALTDALHAAGPTLLVAVDEEGGDVTRLETAGGSTHPGHLALGTVDDLVVTREVGASLGALVDRAGADWTWAPVVDVSSNPQNPAIGVRGFGVVAALVARHAASMVKGLQDDAGVLACAKHFPGHGDTGTDSHRELPVVTAGRAELDEVALAPFRACIDAGVLSIMTAHLRVLAVDADAPATLSKAVISGLLRGELGFEGLVVSDALEMSGVTQVCSIGEGAVRSLLAGVDALCLGGELSDEAVVDEAHRAIVGAVRSGRLPEARLVEAADRLAAVAAWRATRKGRGTPLVPSQAVAHARRAIRTEGTVRLPDGAPVVVTCEPAPLVAAGPSALSLGDLLRARRPGTETLHLSPQEHVLPLLVRTAGRPVVLVVRDPHRHRWQRDVEASLRSLRPDTVVVDVGLPTAAASPSFGRITTHGVSRTAFEAVVDVLTGTPEQEDR